MMPEAAIAWPAVRQPPSSCGSVCTVDRPLLAPVGEIHFGHIIRVRNVAVMAMMTAIESVFPGFPCNKPTLSP